MFSEAWVQEALALLVAAGAALFLIGRLIGPRTGKKSHEEPPVALSSRLARGLSRARKRRRAP